MIRGCSGSALALCVFVLSTGSGCAANASDTEPASAEVETSGPELGAFVVVENTGTVFTGRKRSVVGLSVDNLFVDGDEFSSRVINSLEAGEAWLALGGYEVPVGQRGYGIGYRYFRSRIRPGADFLRDIDFLIRGRTDSLYLSSPDWEGHGWTTSVSFDLTRDVFRLQREASPLIKEINWSFGAMWDSGFEHKDRFSFDLGLGGRGGVDVFDSTNPNRKLSDPNNNSQLPPRFWMGTVNLDLSLRLAGAWHFDAAGYAQQTSEAVAQQCEFGGSRMGRGYDPLEASGDDCVMGILEIQRDPEFFGRSGLGLGPFVAVDYGFLKLKPGVAQAIDVGERSAERSSVSVGLRGVLGEHIEGNVIIGWPIQASGLPPGLSDDVRTSFSVRWEL